MVKEGSDVAIIDYGINNLYSVELACKKAGLSCIITSDKNQILKSKSAILPGVGAFSVAMNNLRKNSLDRIIYRFIETGKPFLGICLGMQLLMEKSLEFGESKGLCDEFRSPHLWTKVKKEWVLRYKVSETGVDDKKTHKQLNLRNTINGKN